MEEEDYKSWEDLLDEEESDGSDDNISEADLSYLKSQVDLPDDINALFKRQKELENNLKKLTGEGDLDPEQARMEKMYPIKVHTKESRIEQRKERREQENKHFQKIKSLKKKIANKVAERRANEKRKEVLKDLNNQRKILHRWEEKRKKSEAEHKKKLQEYEQRMVKLEEDRAAAVLNKRILEKQKAKDWENLRERNDNAKEERLTERRKRKKRKRKTLDIPKKNTQAIKKGEEERKSLFQKEKKLKEKEQEKEEQEKRERMAKELQVKREEEKKRERAEFLAHERRQEELKRKRINQRKRENDMMI